MTAERQGSQTIDNALQVVAVLAEHGQDGTRLTDLAERCHLHKPQVHRVLTSLRRAGYAEQVPISGRYRLGPEFFRVAAGFGDAAQLRPVLHPLLQMIQQRVGQVVHLGVLSGSGVVYLDKVQPTDARITVSSFIGHVNPVITTAMGRVIIAFSGYTEQQFNATFADQFVPRTSSSPQSLAAGWRSILSARSHGYSLDLEENDVGVTCIGFPILHLGTAVAAVSVTGLVEQLGPDGIIEYAMPIRELLAEFLPAPYKST